MSEEELKKLEELTKREEELKKREEELKEREAEAEASKEDTAKLVKQVKDEYEAKLLKLRDTYEKRLKEREEVIKQLLSGSGDANKPHENIIIDKINARRKAQAKKW